MALTIKEKLKKGIEDKNWDLIISAYESLSGETVKLEKKQSGNVNDSFIFNMRDVSTKKQNTKIVANENDSRTDNKKIMMEEDVLKGPRFNMWHDEGTMAKEDKKFDRLVKPKKLTEKGKRQPTYHETSCVRCSKRFSVSLDLVKGFICDNCQRNFSRESI